MVFVALLSMYHVGQSSFLPRFSSFRPIHLSPRSGFGHYGNQESLKGPGSVRLTSLSLVVRNQLHRFMKFFFNFQNNLILTSKDKEVSGTDIFPCRLPPPLQSSPRVHQKYPFDHTLCLEGKMWGWTHTHYTHPNVGTGRALRNRPKKN